MAQLRVFTGGFRFNRLEQHRLLAFLLLGSLMGAFCAKWSECVLNVSFLPQLRSLPLLRMWFRALLFPMLLLGALTLRDKSLFRLLFFGRGFAVSFSLCVFAISGLLTRRELLLMVLLERVLPLPLHLMVGSVWAAETDDGFPELWLAVPLLASSCFGPLMLTFL